MAALPANVYWQLGSSATLGSGSDFVGSLLALTSITLNTGANVSGHILARNGAVTLGTNAVTVCSAGVTCPAIVLNPTTLPPAVLGTPYNQSLAASGGTAPYLYSVSSGALPGGLVLNAATGAISGTPNFPGALAFTITITATHANNCPGNRSYSLQLGPIGGAGTTPVPSLSAWSVLLLVIALAMIGVYRARRLASAR